jgi:hypothetical protein
METVIEFQWEIAMLGRYSLVFVSALCFLSTHSLAQDAKVTLEWVKPSLSSIPSARYGAGIAYDLATSSTVLLGGSNTDGNTYLNDTWVWKNGWVQQSPANSPSPCTTNMAYDATTGTFMLFGGYNGSEALGDTWTWDGVTWTQQFPPLSPSPRTNNGMTFDAATGTILLFGGAGNGLGDGDVFNDTWEWNGKTKTWVHLFPASSPSPRRTTIAYDRATGNVVLFGGDTEQYGCCDTFYGDTWTWNGVTWTEQFPSSAPTARTLNSLNYYSTGTSILFGGYNNWPNGLGDTWTWNGTTWTELQTTFSPSPRWDQSVDFDPNSKGLVLFGGVVTGSSTVGDTWLLILHR